MTTYQFQENAAIGFCGALILAIFFRSSVADRGTKINAHKQVHTTAMSLCCLLQHDHKSRTDAFEAGNLCLKDYLGEISIVYLSEFRKDCTEVGLSSRGWCSGKEKSIQGIWLSRRLNFICLSGISNLQKQSQFSSQIS